MNLVLKIFAPGCKVEKNSGKKPKKTASFRALLKKIWILIKGSRGEETKKKEGTVIFVQWKTFKSMGSDLESTANVSLSFTSLKKNQKNCPHYFYMWRAQREEGGSFLSPVSPLYLSVCVYVCRGITIFTLSIMCVCQSGGKGWGIERDRKIKIDRDRERGCSKPALTSLKLSVATVALP